MQFPRERLALLRSNVLATGFGCLDGSIDEPLLSALREEVLVQRASARRVTDDGVISYKGYLADLGDTARRFLTGPAIAGLLQTVFDRSFVLTASSSCSTYYESGDFLSTHRDGADDCEVTVLVYLDATSPDPDAADTGLRLQIYEDHADTPRDLIAEIKTRSGGLVVGRGSKVWHGRPPLRDGERVALLTACFNVAS